MSRTRRSSLRGALLASRRLGAKVFWRFGGEDDPTIPIMETTSGTFGSVEYSFLFDLADLSYRGSVHNPTFRPICRSRTEIHGGIGGASVVELGPTVPVDLMPGETVPVVVMAPDYMPDIYAVHPESSQCP